MAYGDEFIKTTLKLAKKGKGLVSPNPMVGAVIVKGKRILGEGYHQAWGMAHAEVEAIRKAKGKTKGATLYVNLEPCNHYGKTSPCVKTIIEAGIKEVVCPMKDPNPTVNGKGFEELEKNGIKVRIGSMQQEAEDLNRAYIVNLEKKRPYIRLKWAQTLDGKTATYSGNSKWITNEPSRQYAKRLRFESDAILVGIRTVLNDNPSLDYIFPTSYPSKLENRKKYFKVILDPELKMPTEGNIWKTINTEILIVTSMGIPKEKISKYLGKSNCEIVEVPTKNRMFDMAQLLKILFERGIGVLMVEGGSSTLTSFWEYKLADEVFIFCANKIVGDNRSISSISGVEKKYISESVEIKIKKTKMFEQNIMIKGKPCFQE
jgi:diaminohydroxyphosphoribosylaminopyrimidine deaminase/5-amino-6-(5-phosphoribosylamino)uracil reductase